MSHKFIEGPCVHDNVFCGVPCNGHGVCMRSQSGGYCSCSPAWTNFNGFGFQRGQVCLEHVLAMQILLIVAAVCNLVGACYGVHKIRITWLKARSSTHVTSRWVTLSYLSGSRVVRFYTFTTGFNLLFLPASLCKLITLETAALRMPVIILTALGLTLFWLCAREFAFSWMHLSVKMGKLEKDENAMTALHQLSKRERFSLPMIVLNAIFLLLIPFRPHRTQLFYSLFFGTQGMLCLLLGFAIISCGITVRRLLLSHIEAVHKRKDKAMYHLVVLKLSVVIGTVGPSAVVFGLGFFMFAFPPFTYLNQYCIFLAIASSSILGVICMYVLVFSGGTIVTASKNENSISRSHGHVSPSMKLTNSTSAHVRTLPVLAPPSCEHQVRTLSHSLDLSRSCGGGGGEDLLLDKPYMHNTDGDLSGTDGGSSEHTSVAPSRCEPLATPGDPADYLASSPSFEPIEREPTDLTVGYDSNDQQLIGSPSFGHSNELERSDLGFPNGRERTDQSIGYDPTDQHLLTGEEGEGEGGQEGGGGGGLMDTATATATEQYHIVLSVGGAGGEGAEGGLPGVPS
eukprot:gb/GEZN01004897.1/.p1 GENE.gb/GEZN01004897.1/~~gb/GEZN01004897.1/.p1  ORF type:complete len:569 (-),score=35.75 gb/GEZN01004897.1/:131-1837(-)